MKASLIFIDFNKAFDSVAHTSILAALTKHGVSRKIILAINKLYKKSKAYVSSDKEGEIFTIQRGVEQGDLLSPNIFNAILEEIFRKLEWDGLGLKIGGKC